MGSRFEPHLVDLFSERENELLRLGHRLSQVLSVHLEMQRVSRGKLFAIRNELVFQSLVAEQEMIEVDLGSWAKAFYSKGGFLRKVQSRSLRSVRRGWTHNDVEALAAVPQNAEWREAAYSRLFPAVVADVPCPQDVDLLAARLCDEFGPLLESRHARAHKHERQTATANILSAEETKEHFQRCAQLLADLYCLSSNGHLTGRDFEPKGEPTNQSARDAIDLILIGSIDEIHAILRATRCKHPWSQVRDTFYVRCHELHEKRGAREDGIFNVLPGFE